MGCSESRNCTVFLCWEGVALGKKIYGSRSLTSSGDYDIDLSSFSAPKRILGIGGFGMVRAVTKIGGADKNTAYALKSLSKSAVLQRSSGTTAVLSELKALALLVDAKFICNVHYAFQDAIFLYMIIDFAAGGDLRFALKFSPNCRFNEVRARFYIAQIILAIDSCHAASILHRDIKPENILLQANGYLLLSDFGVAKILQDVEDCRSTSGTHGYMAPEIYLPHHRHGTAADWFALGVTLHEFVTGRRPFETSKLQAFRNGEANAGLLSLVFLESCNYISESCKDFIAGLLVPKPSRRLGSYRGIEEMKQHSWLGGFDWDKLISQSLPAPYKPDISFDRTDVKGENMRKAVYDHINSKSIAPTDQHHFQSYEYHRRYYTCGEYESPYHQTKPTMSINTSPVVSTGTGPATAVAGPSTVNGHTIRQSQLPLSSVQSPTATFTKLQDDGRLQAHCRKKIAYCDGTAEVVLRDSRQTQPQSKMVWMLKSALTAGNSSRGDNQGNSNFDDHRQQQQQSLQRPFVISQKGQPRPNLREVSRFGNLEFASSKNKYRSSIKASKSDEEEKSFADSKSSNVEYARESEKSAVATGSTITGSAASAKLRGSQSRSSVGDKNYMTSQQTRKEAKESSVVHSDESAQQTYSSAPRSMLTSLSTVARETGVIGCYANNFKSQKDKRQKLDSVQIIVESENEIVAPQLSSCLIRPKSNRIESLYTRHQQHNFQKPPVINTNKIPTDIGRSDVIESLERDDNSVHATASAGVRMFHGLDQVPNISDEEGNAADWAGHAMSSTSAPVELSGENSKTVLGDMSSKKLNDITPDSGGVSRVSESPRSRKKSAGQSLAGTPEEKRPLCNINEKLLEATVSPCGDSTVSYRDQVISNEIQNQTTSAPSVQIDPLTSRGQLSSFVKKNSGSSLSEWPPPDNKRPGSQRLSGRYYDWNTDNSQDGDNASVSIVSPDATDNKELNL